LQFSRQAASPETFGYTLVSVILFSEWGVKLCVCALWGNTMEKQQEGPALCDSCD
jgi:hypothetical protein